MGLRTLSLSQENKAGVLFLQEGCTISGLGSSSAIRDGGPFVCACLARLEPGSQHRIWKPNEPIYLLNSPGDQKRQLLAR